MGKKSKNQNETLDRIQIIKMRWILFCVFTAIFVIIVFGTLLIIFFGLGEPTENERNILFNVFIVEVGVSMTALFGLLFNLKKKPGVDPPVSNVSGNYEYEITCSDSRVTFLGECRIKQEGRRLHFSGERKKQIDGDEIENVSIAWFSQWGEICLDNKIRLDYSLTVNGGVRGYAALVVEAEPDEQDTLVGEFHLLEQAHVCGTVKFKKRLPKIGK
jgi:hypothetical protein